MLGLIGIELRNFFLHAGPDIVGNGDAVTVQVHGEWGDDVGVAIHANGRSQGLTRQHVRTVKLARDDVVQELGPVWLR